MARAVELREEEERGMEPAAQEIIRMSELAVGDSAEIVKVGAVGEIKKRLLEMGVVAGARVKVERLAPLGDPIELLIMGYHLSLRHTEAREIMVRRLGG